MQRVICLDDRVQRLVEGIFGALTAVDADQHTCVPRTRQANSTHTAGTKHTRNAKCTSKTHEEGN